MFDSSFVQYHDHITGDRFFGVGIDGVYPMKIEQVSDFLSAFARTIPQQFIILTHNGDYSITSHLLQAAKSIPNFKMWYGQNVDCESDSRVQSIPIGLENDIHFQHIGKRRLLFEASRQSGTATPSKLAYLNFSMWTNPPVRYDTHACFKDKTWVTDECLNATVQENYSYWLSQVLDHHYVLCPRGNGIDTHRLWETLYMGRIPIALNDRNTRYYQDLPILLVDKWSDVTPKLLEENIERFSDTSKFNMDMLKFSWWSSLIKKEITKNGNA